MDTETRHTALHGWRRNTALALCLVVGLFYLLAEHRAHLFGVLPYLLLLACPLAHVFLHGRHGHGHDGDRP